MAEELDDWLDDPADEEDESSEEMDQSDIDSLLSGDDSSEPAAEAATEEEGDELDQSDIDSLLSGDDSPEPAAEAAAEEDGELDQSDIDSLLSGDDSSEPAAEAAAEEEGDELDQSDIDSLLSGDDSLESETVVAGGEEVDEELDQTDIDDLLSGGSDPSLEDDAENSPDQEEIDRLFSEIDDDQEEADPFQAEEIDFKDVISEDKGDDLETSNEFADEEFNFDDDIPDISPDDDETTVFEAREDDAQAKPPTDETQNSGEGSSKSINLGKLKLPVNLPPFLQERKNQGIAAGCIVVLIAISIFLFSGGEEEPEIADSETDKQTQQPAEPTLPVKVANTPPQVNDQEYLLSKNEASAIVLTAQDAEGDTLYYELLSQPQYGKLNGQAPNLVYTPNPDFPGEDRFDFRVNDGKDFSPPVLATVIGQIADIEPQEPPPIPEPKDIKPRKLVISAKNSSYSVTGTRNLLLDWEAVWSEANYLPFSNQVVVEILTNPHLGSLKKISSNLHRYNAKKYLGGTETIRYRFKLGKLRSKIKEINIAVNSGNPAPEIRLQPISRSYQPGEMAMLDASRSMDNDRKSLLFSWQQLSGVPVQLEVLNQEGSKVAFVVPSSFNTTATPGPMMRLTTIDKSGKTDVMDIKIPTTTRYKSALWGGLANNRL